MPSTRRPRRYHILDEHVLSVSTLSVVTNWRSANRELTRRHGEWKIVENRYWASDVTIAGKNRLTFDDA